MDDIDIMQQALKLEKTGEEFYTDAVKASSDPETSKMFQQLAEDEKQHSDVIARQLEAVMKRGEWLEIPELKEVIPIDIDEPIFEVNVKVLEKMPEEATEKDALLFALGAEVKTFEIYMTGAKTAKSQVGREMYLKLAQIERGHFDTLMLRYEGRFVYPN